MSDAIRDLHEAVRALGRAIYSERVYLCIGLGATWLLMVALFVAFRLL